MQFPWGEVVSVKGTSLLPYSFSGPEACAAREGAGCRCGECTSSSKCKKQKREDADAFSGLRRYILMCAQVYNAPGAVRTRPGFFNDKSQIFTSNDHRFERMRSLLAEFAEWGDGCGNRNREFIPRTCFYDLELTLRTPYVLTRFYLDNPRLPQFQQRQRNGAVVGSYILLSQWHQDYCEHHFQHQRGFCGQNKAPNCHEAARNAAFGRVQTQNRDMKKGNTSALRAHPESHPALSRVDGRSAEARGRVVLRKETDACLRSVVHIDKQHK